MALYDYACIPIVIALSTMAVGAHGELGGTQQRTPAIAGHAILNGAINTRTWVDAGGTTIDEYATATGQIIAYTWHGPTMPDLHALLGSYDASYRAGAADPSGTAPGLHAARVATPDVIVESGGQMRSYVGRAWLPAALPPGVKANELR